METLKERVMMLEEPLFMEGAVDSTFYPFPLSIEAAWERIQEEQLFEEKVKGSTLDVRASLFLTRKQQTHTSKLLKPFGSVFHSFVVTKGPCKTNAHVEDTLAAGCIMGRQGEKLFSIWKNSPYEKDGTSMSGRKPDVFYTVKSGDMLWIPSGYWHEVETTTELAMLEGFVFYDKNTLSSLERQPRQVYQTLRGDDLERVAEMHNMKLSKRLKSTRHANGFPKRRTGAIAEIMARRHAKNTGGTTRRDASGHKRRKRIC